MAHPSTLLAWTHATILVTLLALVFLAARAGRSALRRATPETRRLWAGLAALAALAYALRLWVSPHAFVHENFHAHDALEHAFFAHGPRGFGELGAAIYRALASVFGARAELIFHTHAVLSTLGVAALVLVDLALFGRPARALFAGLLLAVLPAHLRYSSGEDLFAPALAFALAGLALLTFAIRVRSLGAALAAGFAAALAAQGRTELFVWPVIGLVVLAATEGVRALWRRETGVALVAFVAAALPRLIDLATEGGSRAALRFSPPAFDELANALALFDADAHTPVLWTLAAVGAAYGLARVPRVHAALLLGAVAFTVLPLCFFNNASANVRLQLPALPFVVLLAATGFEVARAAMAMALRTPTLQRVAASAMALAFAGTTLGMRVPYVLLPGHEEAQWDFQKRMVAHLPAQGVLLAAFQPGPRALDAFPRLLLEQHGKRLVPYDQRIAHASGHWPKPDTEVHYYEGLHCYFTFLDEPPPAERNPHCASVRERFRLEPVMVADLAPTRLYPFHYAHGGRRTFRVGLYRAHVKPDASWAAPTPTAERAPHRTTPLEREASSPSGGPLVIQAGRESVVKALFAPLQLGEPLADDVTMANLSIRVDVIEVSLTRAGQPAGTIRVHPPGAAQGDKVRAGLMWLTHDGAPQAAFERVRVALAARTSSQLPWTRPGANAVTPVPLPPPSNASADPRQPVVEVRAVHVPWAQLGWLAAASAFVFGGAGLWMRRRRARADARRHEPR